MTQAFDSYFVTSRIKNQPNKRPWGYQSSTSFQSVVKTYICPQWKGGACSVEIFQFIIFYSQMTLPFATVVVSWSGCIIWNKATELGSYSADLSHQRRITYGAEPHSPTYEHLARCPGAELSALCGTNASQHDGCWALAGAWTVHLPVCFPDGAGAPLKADEALSCLQASVRFQNRAWSYLTLPFLKLKRAVVGKKQRTNW